MAIAGLHNISVLDSSFLWDAQSRGSRRRGDGVSASTRASLMLQMRREFEDDQAVIHTQDGVSEIIHSPRSNEPVVDLSSSDVSESQSECRFGSEDAGLESNEDGSPSQIGSRDDSNSSICRRSPDFGQVVRGRVRQIFQDWMNSGHREHPSNVSRVNNNSRVEWLGEVEQERVRLIRQRVQIRNCHQRGPYGESREDQTAEIGRQTDHVLDGSDVNPIAGQPERSRGCVRKLCGRQALLDMLKKAERERQRELQGLLAHGAVSHFAHRNRIQSLLRGRFLRNERMFADGRTSSSIAASELGLLRERHTVTGLRDVFLSRMDHSACGQVRRDPVDTLSNGGDNRNDQSQANRVLETPDGFHELSVYTYQHHGIHGVSDVTDDLEGNTVEHISCQEASARAEEQPEQVFQDEVREWQRLTRDNSASNWTTETYRNEDMEQPHLQEVMEVLDDEPEPTVDESSIHGFPDQTDDLEGDYTNNLANWQESEIQVELVPERIIEIDETDQQGARAEPNQQINSTMEDMLRNLQERSVNEWSQELLWTENRVGSNIQENSEVWNEDGEFQEAVQNWLEGPSDGEAVPVGREDIIYPSGSETVYNMELRELLSRRSVSNLLRSGFRANLDQLIESYVLRQSHATMDSEMHGTSPIRASAEQDLEHQHRDQNEGHEFSVETSLSLPPPPTPPARSIWDQESQPHNWPQYDMHQRSGTESDIINDLRIEVIRLQQRMNNMQRSLEACMDMQLELQRSIRQEFSAALNRSAESPGVSVNGLHVDKSKWDNTRKGICCICCATNIDSLLYRCGHMCTCSKCANSLLETRDKCPMCQAPVVEVIHAFAIT